MQRPSNGLRTLLLHVLCWLANLQDTFALAFALAGHSDKYRQVRPERSTCCKAVPQCVLSAAEQTCAAARWQSPSTTHLGLVCCLLCFTPCVNTLWCCQQVSLVPGGVFRWGRDQLEVKATGPNSSAHTADGWQLLGALQYDDTGVSACSCWRSAMSVRSWPLWVPSFCPAGLASAQAVQAASCQEVSVT